jgi:hypothetical protein
MRRQKPITLRIASDFSETFYASPVLQIQAVLKSHTDICAERHQFLQKYHQKTLADSNKLADGLEKRAYISLTSWVMKWFKESLNDCAVLEMKIDKDGKRVFSKRIRTIS